MYYLAGCRSLNYDHSCNFVGVKLGIRAPSPIPSTLKTAVTDAADCKAGMAMDASLIAIGRRAGSHWRFLIDDFRLNSQARFQVLAIARPRAIRPSDRRSQGRMPA